MNRHYIKTPYNICNQLRIQNEFTSICPKCFWLSVLVDCNLILMQCVTHHVTKLHYIIIANLIFHRPSAILAASFQTSAKVFRFVCDRVEDRGVNVLKSGVFMGVSS